MSGPLDIDLLVSLTDIAELAGKTPSAVSNWRKRYQTFPLPKVESPSGALFDFREVEKWLVETDRLDRPIQPSQVLWNVANSLRDLWTLDQISGFIFAALVYFEACHRAESPQSDVRMNSTLLWKELQWVPEDQFSARFTHVRWIRAVSAAVGEGLAQSHATLGDGGDRRGFTSRAN